MVPFLVLFYSFVFINAAEYYCDRDKFPLISDFSPDDCDNDNYYFYKENAINDCFPGCVKTAEDLTDNSCLVAACPPGYYCPEDDDNPKCKLNETSCYKYYATGSKYLAAKWKPECLTDETWAPKQCKGEPANGRCFCFDPSGNRIFGEEFSYQAENMTCACSRKRAEMEASGDHVFVSLHCDSMGNYDPLQCDVESEHCWCVQPQTGDLTSTVVPLSLMTKLPCYNETTVGSQYLRQCESQKYAQLKIADEFAAHGTTRVSFKQILCRYDGSYGPYTLSSNTIAYCVWSDNSYIGSYQSTVTTTTSTTVNCNCARDEQMYTNAGLAFTLTCQANGNYQALQTDADGYFCVDDDGFMKTDLLATSPTCTKFY